MDGGAPGEVERAQLVEPAPRAPHPVRDRVVDEGGPQQGEEHEGLEALALSERAADQGRRDDREHHLEKHERLVGKDRKSTRLNSSHQIISYAVFCLKKK